MWFLKEFPDSLAPVKVEYAAFLSNNSPDSATQLAREYLRYVDQRGAMTELSNMPMIRRDCSKAFLIFTSVYTTLGARSYSQRILKHASQLPLTADFIDMYRVELERLSEELKDPEIARRNEQWECFYRNGSNTKELYDLCMKNNCPLLADRIDLIEANFRFNAEYQIGPEEWFQLVMMFRTPDGKEGKVLN